MLLGYGSDSDSSSVYEAELPKQTADVSKAADQVDEESTSDDEEDEAVPRGHKPTPTTSKPKSLLPSVDDLFASSGPSFLAAPKDEFTVAPMKKRKIETLPESTAEPTAPPAHVATAVAAPAPKNTTQAPKPASQVALLSYFMAAYFDFFY